MAQPNRATKIYNENAAADERRLQKLKDEGRTPNAPGRGTGSSVTKDDAEAVGEILTGGKATRKAYEEHEAERKAQQAVRDREAEARQKARDAEHGAAVREQAGLERQAVAAKAQFIADGMAKTPLDGMLPEEVKEGLNMEWLQKKYAWMKRDFMAGRAEAKARIKRFDELQETASYDTLLALLKRSSIFPGSTGRRLGLLRTRYPERLAETERVTLANVPYYFGAKWPYLTEYNAPGGDYPESIFEMATPEYRGMILARFLELWKKYPEETRVAAGTCRPHLIPFNICATSWCKDDSCRAEMYMGTLRMKMPDQRALDDLQWGDAGFRYSDEHFVCFNAQRLGAAAQWLMANRLSELQALSKEDWLQIAAEKNLSVKDFVWSFRDPKSDPFDYDHRLYYKQRYKHLKALAKAAELK